MSDFVCDMQLLNGIIQVLLLVLILLLNLLVLNSQGPIIQIQLFMDYFDL